MNCRTTAKAAGASPIRHSRRAVLRGGVVAVGALFAATAMAAAEPPIIAAASSVQSAVEEIAAAFLAETGQGVRLSFGASGTLARQIEQGAPFQLFMSADEAYATYLVERGLTLDPGTIYVLGRIGLFVSNGSRIGPGEGLDGLSAALESGVLRRFAIANPDLAPYGRAARQILERAGLWEPIRPHLVVGENVAQATRFALAGDSDGGLIPASLALEPRVTAGGRFTLLPVHWHEPLQQRLVLMKSADAAARAFHDFLLEPTAADIFRRHGFEIP